MKIEHLDRHENYVPMEDLAEIDGLLGRVESTWKTIHEYLMSGGFIGLLLIPERNITFKWGWSSQGRYVDFLHYWRQPDENELVDAVLLLWRYGS